jgi:proteasome lid subunit RPN8/RPN11
MSGFAEINKVSVPKEVTTETQRFLRTVGQRRQEGLVLWVGQVDGQRFQVTQLLIPRQRGIRTLNGVCAIVDSEEMHRINMELFKSGLRLIAQVHSHPTEAYHSDTDDENAIANTVGCLSLVIPDFATREFNLNDTAVYRLDRKGTWESVDQSAARALLQIE